MYGFDSRAGGRSYLSKDVECRQIPPERRNMTAVRWSLFSARFIFLLRSSPSHRVDECDELMGSNWGERDECCDLEEPRRPSASSCATDSVGQLKSVPIEKLR